MPNGVMQWFDPKTGDGVILRAGRVFAVAASDVETEARHAGARVHFDISHDNPDRRAVNVTLRKGTRGAVSHKNVGTLVGARRPDTKGSAPFAHDHPELTRELASHPIALVRMWADRVQSGDLDTALALYAPDAAVHLPSATLSGHAHLQALLEASGPTSAERPPDLRGEGELIVATWPSSEAYATGRSIRSRIVHGMIAEQWFDESPVATATTATAAHAEIVVQGDVGADVIEDARQRLTAMLDQLAEPILFARVDLGFAHDPARTRPAHAKATVDINGDVVRAHVAAGEMRNALDRLEARLRDQLQHRAEHRRAQHHRNSEAIEGEWHHGDVAPTRPEFFNRPADERQLVRHKVRFLDELTPDEAAFDMDQFDHDFELFREMASGEDAVLERLPGHGYRLTRLHPVAVELGPTAVELKVAETPPARVTVQDAITLLNETHEPFVFFEDPTTGRGDVVYRRYDGHYGLITAG